MVTLDKQGQRCLSSLLSRHGGHVRRGLLQIKSTNAVCVFHFAFQTMQNRLITQRDHFNLKECIMTICCSWLSMNVRVATGVWHTVGVLILLVCTVAGPGVCFAQENTNHVEFESGNFRTDKAPKGGLIAELQSTGAIGGGTILKFSEDVEVEFTDDGDGFDQEAKDGIYTGVLPGDVDTEVKRYESLIKGLQKDVRIPFFSGRELVELRSGRSFIPKERDLELQRAISILGTSGGTSVLIPNSIAITDLSVIEDPRYTYNPCTESGAADGVWTFGHLMTELAAAEGVNPSDFCRRWLEHWTYNVQINTDTAASRQHVYDEIVEFWPRVNDEFSMELAPFRLLGIFNRVDLRSAGNYRAPAGEVRFVYCFTDGCPSPPKETTDALPFSVRAPAPRPFLVIFEYGVKEVGCGVQRWGQRWAELSNLPLGSDQYLETLAKLTTEVTDVHSNPQGHSLLRLRTNELLLPEKQLHYTPSGDWELREFSIADDGHLTQKSVFATPDNNKMGGFMSQGSWVANVVNTGTLVQGVPTFDPADEGASSMNSGSIFWNAYGIAAGNNDRRHLFSLNTCNACHGLETNTRFTHVAPASYGVRTELSGFLTGISVTDPVDTNVERQFSDLERRRQDLQNLIDTHCITQFFRQNPALPILPGHAWSH
jgi:hypothetical protein